MTLPESWIRRLAERLRVLGGNGTNPKFEAVSSCATDGMGLMGLMGVVSSIIKELRSGWIFRSNGDISDHAPGMGYRMGVAGGALFRECRLGDGEYVDLLFSRAISVDI